MRLKSFQAKNMSDALQQIKDMLGDDAIIVSTREAGSGIRVTAAVEQLPPKEIIPESEITDTVDLDDMLDKVTAALLHHRSPALVNERILSALAGRTDTNILAALTHALNDVFSFTPLLSDSSKPLILVGPPGAGKTLMTAKLAAESVLGGQRPTVITTDITRAGGVEQLQAFLDILALPLHMAKDTKDIKNILSENEQAPLTLIDTGGLNPFDPQEMKMLAQLLAAAPLEPALVLPAGMDAEEAAEMALTFQILGVKKLIPTRIDFARRLGGILSAAEKANLSFTIASHTPQVANGTINLSPQKLAELLLPAALTGDTI